MSAVSGFDALDDYVSGHLAAAEGDAFEEALFERAAAGEAEDAVRFDALLRRMRELDERGTFDAVVLESHVRAVRERSRLKVSVYSYPEAVDLEALVQGCDVLFMRLPVQLRGVDRVEVEFGLIGGGPLKRLPDVTFDLEAEAIVLCCEQELASRELAENVVATVIGYTAGVRKVLGRFSGADVHTPGAPLT